MPKAQVAMTYHIETDMTANFVYGDKEYEGSYLMTVVGGEADGAICAAGPAIMRGFMLGMIRLAAYAHDTLKFDELKLHRVLVGDPNAELPSKLVGPDGQTSVTELIKPINESELEQ